MLTSSANAVSNFRYDLINTSDSFLVLEEVSKYFRTFQALDRVDLEIPKGSTIALIGASGSGKSTLLRTLGGFEQPTAGRIWIEGKNMAKMNDKELTTIRRTKMGFIFQSYNLVPVLSAAENVELPLKINKVGRGDRKRRVQEVMEMVGLVSVLL